MKILIITFFFTASAFARNWVPSLDSNTVWTKKSRCEQVNGSKCYNITGKDRRKWMIGQVDDPSKPILRAADASPVKLDCDDAQDCAQKAWDPNGDSNFDDQVCLADGSSPRYDELSNWPGVTGLSGPWFIWCEKHDGTYQKKDALVPDPAGIAQADAEDLDKENEKVVKENKRRSRRTALIQCAKANDLTPAQQKACLRAVTRELVRQYLKSDEM